MGEDEINPALWSHPPEKLSDGLLRPATPLQTHLWDVERRMRVLGTLNDPLVVAVAGLHDIGKLTTWFQQYIRDEIPPGNKTHHSHIGGAVVNYALSEHGDAELDDQLVGALAVLKHHGALPDMQGGAGAFAQQFGDPHGGNAETYDAIEQKLDNIDSNSDARAVAESLINRATAGQGSWTRCKKHIKARENLPKLAKNASHVVSHVNDSGGDFYAHLVDTWTTLTLADTTSAAHIALEELSCGTLDSEAVDQYIENFDAATDAREADLNEIRDLAREIALGRVESFLEADTQVANLTLPTGFGKTLTSTQVGLTLAGRKATRTGRPSRVVYALPFTSIIDQTADELASVFFDAGALDLAVHHHLADVSPDEEPFETDALAERDRMLIRDSWRQQFTLTTFVQLFESLAGPRKSQGLKLPSLRNAVVILDEPQALPPEWMNLVSRLCRVLTDRYNAHVISMTATQPKLFELFAHTPDPFALVEADDSAFSTASPMSFIDAHPRVRYTIHPSADSTTANSPFPPEDAAATLMDGIESPTLAICNTVSSSRTLATHASDYVGEETLNEQFAEWVAEQDKSDFDADGFVASLDTDRPLVAHLTTRHRPFDRLALIGVAKRLCKLNAPFLFVSTQLIEAGVDVSFDRLYRDFAPAPSIVQAAGRCNRSFDSERQDVCIWKLASAEDSQPPSEVIYSTLAFGDPLAATETALEEHREGKHVAETAMISEVVDKYYSAYHTTSGTTETSLPVLVDEANCATLSTKHIIDQQSSIDVLVPRTDTEAKKIAQLAVQADVNKQAVQEARGMQSITVSIPAYRSNQDNLNRLRTHLLPVDEDIGLYVLPQRSTYDAFLGLRTPDSTVGSRIIG
ncbi:CRISPR-associated endonuclease Cas3'' [Halegenticoccus tardaugens]|uniref:CRISPR-associated endonuclease Cas3'' n=1 Tax=Halegenticoccus tardaugens TaxID=2071624 RepID=UPI00100A9B75|nr:CRISPR-associated endonuclease Cas3'' [Halegenticoccus tardaugens]